MSISRLVRREGVSLASSINATTGGHNRTLSRKICRQEISEVPFLASDRTSSQWSTYFSDVQRECSDNGQTIRGIAKRISVAQSGHSQAIGLAVECFALDDFLIFPMMARSVSLLLLELRTDPDSKTEAQVCRLPR